MAVHPVLCRYILDSLCAWLDGQLSIVGPLLSCKAEVLLCASPEPSHHIQTYQLVWSVPHKAAT